MNWLTHFLLSQLQNLFNVEEMRFQRDGTTAQRLPPQGITFRDILCWPPCSSDLSVYDLRLPRTVDDLKVVIRDEMLNAMQNFE